MAKRDSTQAKTVCHTRQIKVTRTYYDYRLKDQPSNTGARPIPWLQLKGHWLQQAGFEIDAPVTVRIMEGCLVLTVEPQANSG